jgi:16S rRNA (cytosine1402-N4)-methyltransferase
MYHKSVLLNESVDALQIDSAGTYVDVTFGGGGHSKEIVGRLGEGRLFAFDQDEDAHKNAIEDDRFTLIPQNFKFLKNFLRLHGGVPADGVLADLGVSSHQFDVGDRGFSIRFDGPLDMRMNQAAKLDAKKVVNEYEEKELVRIFKVYGELKNAFKVAQAIVFARDQQEINTTNELLQLIERFAQPRKRNQFFAQVFQALRIEVNDEMGALEAMLEQAADVLKPGGRLVVISYHSLEDRLVKHFMRAGNFSGDQEKDFFGNILRPLDPTQGKVIVPSDEEIEGNSRARSAKMRVAVKR